MVDRRTYSDDALLAAVATATSWRGVLRLLGLRSTSGSALRSVRFHADRLGLDHSHFHGGRGWSDAQLVTAIGAANTWAGVAETLGLLGGSSETTLKGHARRLGLATDHLRCVQDTTRPEALLPGKDLVPDSRHLRRSGSLLAAAWFTLCGCEVSWPLEPERYDLLVLHESRLQRVQVKTTTVRTTSGWTVWLSSSRGRRVPYSPDEIDAFFIVTASLDLYLIPIEEVAGMHSIQLSSYDRFRLESWA